MRSRSIRKYPEGVKTGKFKLDDGDDDDDDDDTYFMFPKY